MPVFIDTSAIIASLSAEDTNHQSAVAAWAILVQQSETLITSNYVVVEAIAVIGRRFGLSPVRILETQMVPILRVHWVNEALHQRAMSALLTAGARDLSLVDCVSFELMRQLGLDTVFAFDAHFAQQGFTCLP